MDPHRLHLLQVSLTTRGLNRSRLTYPQPARPKRATGPGLGPCPRPPPPPPTAADVTTTPSAAPRETVKIKLHRHPAAASDATTLTSTDQPYLKSSQTPRSPKSQRNSTLRHHALPQADHDPTLKNHGTPRWASPALRYVPSLPPIVITLVVRPPRMLILHLPLRILTSGDRQPQAKKIRHRFLRRLNTKSADVGALRAFARRGPGTLVRASATRLPRRYRSGPTTWKKAPPLRP